jgi:hypothetical protein
LEGQREHQLGSGGINLFVPLNFTPVLISNSDCKVALVEAEPSTWTRGRMTTHGPIWEEVLSCFRL